MPLPTQSDVHVDKILTNISIAFKQNAANYVHNKVFPVIPVDKQSDKYFTFDRDDWLRDEAELRADATESAGGGYAISTDNYYAPVRAFHKDIGSQTRANTDAPLNNDRSAAEYVMQVLMNRQEIEWVSTYFATGIWGNSVTPSTTWDDYTGSDPISDIELGKETVLKNTGFEPNVLVLGYQTFRHLKHHPDFIDLVKYVQTGFGSEQIIADAVGVDRVVVAKAIKNTALENATPAYAFTHGKHALLAYSAPTPALETPSAGYTFEWTGVSQGLGETVGMSRFFMDNIKADRVEGEIAYDYKVVSTALGYFFQAAVA